MIPFVLAWQSAPDPVVTNDGGSQWLLIVVGAVVVAAVGFGLSRLMGGGRSSPEPRESFSGFSGASDDTPRSSATPPPPPPRTDTKRQPSIFISYRRQDSADITGRVTDRLTQRFGRDAVFKDVESIPLGSDFRKHLKEAVGRCDVLIAVIGRQWTTIQDENGKRRIDDPRDHLRIEVESALERDIPVIPLLVQGASVPDEESLPESLRALAYRNAQQVRPDPDFNHDLDRLMSGIEAHLKRS